jgi:chromosomal replication initiator protein
VSGPSTLDLVTLWNESLEDVMSSVASPAQRQWLAATHPVGFSEDTVVLASPHAFAREWLERSCGEKIRSALSHAAGRPLTVVITVQTRPEPVDHLRGSSQERPVPVADDLRDGHGASAPATSESTDPPEAHHTYAEDEPNPRPHSPLEAPGRPAGPTVQLPEPRARTTEHVEPQTQLNPKYSFDDCVIG